MSGRHERLHLRSLEPDELAASQRLGLGVDGERGALAVQAQPGSPAGSAAATAARIWLARR
jgi:hypothetical protein